MEKRKNIKLPKDFFTKPRPHVTKKEKDEDMIPYAWSNEILSGKKKAILYSVKKEKSS